MTAKLDKSNKNLFFNINTPLKLKIKNLIIYPKYKIRNLFKYIVIFDSIYTKRNKLLKVTKKAHIYQKYEPHCRIINRTN